MAAPALFDLEGRIALVTGASSGIGREIAFALAEAGASVVLAARREEVLERSKASIGERAAVLAVDLSRRDALRDAAKRSAKFFGDPDILVNAAGINIRKPLLEVTRPIGTR
jgi:gluconate 5-dehydrogenase